MDRARPVERNTGGIKKSFYTVSETADVLGVGQRRVLEMLKTREIEGERDPTSSRWKISKHAVHELASEEPTGTKEPLLFEQPPVTEEVTVKPRVAEEAQATEETADIEEPPLVGALQEEVARLRSELSTVRERVGELEQLNEHLQLEHQTEKAAWQEEKGALLTTANRELQHAEMLQKEVARLSTELEANLGLTSELERLNERLQLERQAEKAAWQEEKESLLAAADRERQHAAELKGEVQRLSAELENERRKPVWHRLFRQ